METKSNMCQLVIGLSPIYRLQNMVTELGSAQNSADGVDLSFGGMCGSMKTL